jgi:hypothetical protein
MLESIAGFKAWAAVPTKDYSKAVATFENDLESAKRLDRDQVSFSGFPQDTDPRKGEVEVPGTCSLHSTDQGFQLVTHQKAATLVTGGGGCSVREAGRREYEVNSQTGTITVTEMVGTSSWGGAWAGSTPGYTERYTIDTVNGTIVDYSKNPGHTGGAIGASGLKQAGVAGMYRAF